MRERQQELSEMKSKLMKVNLVILIVFCTACASHVAVESARKDIKPIKEPEPVGYPDNYEYTVYIPDNTL